jgi:predicted nucleic acid-binding protein
MIIVLDTSAALEILLKKENSDRFKKALLEADTVIAPELYISEITNVAWKYNKIAQFKHEECYRISEDGINLIDQFIDAKDLWKEALREAINNNQSVYDCQYLICARRNDGILLTLDQKLKKLCSQLKIEAL